MVSMVVAGGARSNTAFLAEMSTEIVTLRHWRAVALVAARTRRRLWPFMIPQLGILLR